MNQYVITIRRHKNAIKPHIFVDHRKARIALMKSIDAKIKERSLK